MRYFGLIPLAIAVVTTSALPHDGTKKNAPLPQNAACKTNVDCVSGLCQDAVCRQPDDSSLHARDTLGDVPLKGQCSADLDCTTHHCVSQVCQKPKELALKATCAFNVDCASGLCQDAVCRQPK